MERLGPVVYLVTGHRPRFSNEQVYDTDPVVIAAYVAKGVPGWMMAAWSTTFANQVGRDASVVLVGGCDIDDVTVQEQVVGERPLRAELPRAD